MDDIQIVRILAPLVHANLTVPLRDLAWRVETVLKARDAEISRLRTALEKIKQETCIMGTDAGDAKVHEIADKALKER